MPEVTLIGAVNVKGKVNCRHDKRSHRGFLQGASSKKFHELDFAICR
jgi:hypothetical protein